MQSELKNNSVPYLNKENLKWIMCKLLKLDTRVLGIQNNV